MNFKLRRCLTVENPLTNISQRNVQNNIIVNIADVPLHLRGENKRPVDKIFCVISGTQLN